MVLRFEQVTYRYPHAPASAPPALQDVSLAIGARRFVAVLGAPGSGKSTLLQQLNGLIRPSEGIVRVLDYAIGPSGKLESANELRRRVGLVFQYPERQLFEANVEADLIFGPRNFGLSLGEAKAAARSIAEWIGLDPALLAASPLAISGGQRRLAAIAAVLVSDPEVLALDEPTASLDPAGRSGLLSRLRDLVDERDKTVLVVSHRLEEIAPYADEYVVLEAGRILYHGDGAGLFAREDILARAGARLPAGVRLVRRFAEAFGVEPPAGYLSADEAAAFIERTVAERKGAMQPW